MGTSPNCHTSTLKAYKNDHFSESFLRLLAGSLTTHRNGQTKVQVNSVIKMKDATFFWIHHSSTNVGGAREVTHLLCLEAKKWHDVIQTLDDGRGKMSIVGALQKERKAERMRGNRWRWCFAITRRRRRSPHLQQKPTGWRRMEKDYVQLKTPFAKNNGSKSILSRSVTYNLHLRVRRIHKVETTFLLAQVVVGTESWQNRMHFPRPHIPKREQDFEIS